MRGALLGLLFLGSGGAFAHAHLVDSAPADGSRLAAAPEALMLSFSEAARLTALSIETPDGASAKLTPPAAAQVRIRIVLPKLAPGAYVVHFRALAADGHVAPGEIRFTIAP